MDLTQFRRLSLLFLGLLGCCLPLSPDTRAEDPQTEKAIIIVRLPKTASLLIDGKATQQSGSERRFETPPLQAGQVYSYTLTVVWQEAGKSKRLEQQVNVRGGRETQVDLEAAATAHAAKERQPSAAGKSRTFQFTYRATVTGLKPGQKARIWLPVPSTSEDQDVEILAKEAPPDSRLTQEMKFGNRMLYVEANPDAKGEIPLSIQFQVTRREVKGENSNAANVESDFARYLLPDKMVPTGGKPLSLIKDKQLPSDQLASARVLYDAVNSHMRYSKEGVGWGRGDSVWACENGYGNCSDFHSLFITLARSQKIPAKFEIGFPLPPQHGSGDIPGYHCWAKFHPVNKGWIPVDISEANKNPAMLDYFFGNLTADRLTFSTGRDLDLSPRQDGPPLNFFVYPYVEVDGKAYPADTVKKRFTFKDDDAK